MTELAERWAPIRRACALAIVGAALAGLWLASRVEPTSDAKAPRVAGQPAAAVVATDGEQVQSMPQAIPLQVGKQQAERALSLLHGALVDADAVRAAVESGWPSREPESLPAKRSIPRVPVLRPADASAMERKFRSMPPDKEWEQRSESVVPAQRARLGRGGLHLAKAECRQDACRFEVVLTGARAEGRRKRFGGQPRTLATEQSAVHTTFEPSGAVRSVIYLGRKGPMSLG